MTTKAMPPSPPGRFLLGHLGELRKDVLSFYARVAREQGDVALVRFGLKPVYVLSHPEAIEEVLTSRNFIKHYALRMNRRLLGNGLLSSEGDFWKRQRRLIQPAFLRERVNRYADTMVAYSERWAGVWRDGEVRNIHADMRQLTMEIAARTLFGADVEGQGPIVAQALLDVMESFSSRLFSVLRLPESFPTPSNIRAWRAVKRLDAILYGLIRDRRAEGTQEDLLSILLHARNEDDGTGMSDKQLRDEAMTLFLAGHETTALALTYTLWLLGQHPEIQERIRAEVRQAAGDGPLEASHFPRLSLTEGVVNEGMRLYPPAYAVGRQAVEPCEVAGYRIPAGGTLLMLQWVVHRDARWWPDPLRFNPDRWANNLARRLPNLCFFPFGGGPRTCIGNHFAMIESVLVLAVLLRHWRIEAVTPQLQFRPRLTLAPASPVEVRLHRISGTA
ncbi:MAG: cytochrome P450 [Gemmataceae bacterium]